MINRGLINRLPLNKTLSAEYVQAETALSESLSAYAVVGADIYSTQTIGEAMQGNIIFVSAINATSELLEAMHADGHALGVLIVWTDISENFTASAPLGADIRVETDIEETLIANSVVGAILSASTDTHEGLDGLGILGANIGAASTLFEMLLASADTAEIYDFILHILESIPPSGTLVIDSDPDRFTVVLNNENAIYLHEGDWITIQPGTQSLALSHSGSTLFDFEVLYRDQYL